ncbi:hypothetical protein V8F33_010966 [Rhypophila sp. PSN 637]
MAHTRISAGLLKTSPPTSSPQTPPRASAQDGPRGSRAQRPSSATSPALSTTSTAGDEASPELPPLRAPKLPDRVLGLLRTPPTNSTTQDDTAEGNPWGSPYPPHLRGKSDSDSLSSESSDDSPIHQLSLRTPFLREAPSVQESPLDTHQPAISAAAAVLANRARRVANNITEGWIRQHTAGGSDLEKRHWFSDGTGDSENSSLSGSFSSDDAAWTGESDIRTPRASRVNTKARQVSRAHSRTKSSSETLRQAHLKGEKDTSSKMASSDERVTPDVARDDSTPVFDRPSTPKPVDNGAADGSALPPTTITNAPSTPPRAVRFAANTNLSPRFRKRLPWKGKNILIHLPKDVVRGRPGHRPKPLTEAEVTGMLRSWEELGYNTKGFELDSPSQFAAPGENSQSRGAWPDFDELVSERKAGDWKVQLPDLNAWKKYVDELNEAKLRALGVSFGSEDVPLPTPSPGSTLSRQPSVTQYPALPFSPPLPTSSASSAHGLAGFQFPGPMVTSGAPSPGIPAGISPISFTSKYNPRASISIPSPHGWSPQLMLHQGHRAGSPSLANLHSMMSPSSPFSPDGMNSPGPGLHQRHQSLQFPVLPHQFQPPVRASPRLQDLREIEEEVAEESRPGTPEPAHAHHGASDSLQREIEEAEYHLEEQMRSQLENDEDYSPHNGNDGTENMHALNLAHARDPSVQFAPQPAIFGADAHGVVLHHPRPHSRGHSLSQKYFTEDDVSGDRGGFRPTLQGIDTQAADESEVETNPSNLGTPVQGFDFGKMMHQRSFSTASNPWTDNESGKSAAGSLARRPSHGSKSSFSKLNVEAPEFKFNPANTFKPGQFAPFSSNSFQPAVFNAGLGSASSSQFSLPMTSSSKINVNAPAFSPGQSEFSFSASGPKFRPDAPAFTPHSLSNSITSPIMSGGEGSSNRGSSIFGNIDLSTPEIVVPAKKSKAIPILKPDSPEPDSRVRDGVSEGPDGRLQDESRVKRARSHNADDGAVPLFAQPSEEATPVPEPKPELSSQEDDIPAEEKSFDESQLGPADTTMSSTIVSESTDTKASSPTETLPDQGALNWTPFEFKNTEDLQSFAEARPFGDDVFTRQHKKSLSATAKAFVPGVPAWEASDDQAERTDDDLAAGLEEPMPRSTSVDEITREETTEPATDGPAHDEPEEPKEQIQPPPSASPVAEEVQPSVPVARGGLATSRYASPPSPPKRTGLAASRFAASPSPVPDDTPVAPTIVSPLGADEAQQTFHPSEDSSSVSHAQQPAVEDPAEPSLDDIDAIMRHFNENPSKSINRALDSQPEWHQPSPSRHISLAAVTDASPLRLAPHEQFRSDAPSPSPRQVYPIPDMSQPILSTELDDPFVDPPRSAHSFEGPVHRLNGSESLPASDWEGTFSQDEQAKLESRVNFFDGHVNDLVGGLLAARLGPLEETLDAIKHTLASVSKSASSVMRERRSLSAEIKDSDADDEDDELPVRRSMSPRRDRRMEQIRSVVLDALATQQRTLQKEISPAPAVVSGDSLVLKALEDMKQQFSDSLQANSRNEELRDIVEKAVESRLPPAPVTASQEENDEKVNKLQARIDELEERMRLDQAKVEEATTARRAAEDRAADLNRELQSAATKIEVEMMNKSALNQRITDLEDRVHHSESQAEEEVKIRRAAEDRLSEVQRLLRISSEEETRLRELVEEKDQKMKALESAHSKSAMRLALLEANQSNAQQSQSEGQNRINVLETDLRDARLQARNLQAGTDRLSDLAQRREDELNQALDENKALHKLIDTLGIQLQENERIRDTWRSRFLAVQDEMASATRAITEENARRAKKEQALLARQEVLDAKLQAEARTRERIETELERLEMGERQGMRAVAECKRLEVLLGELRTENHKLQQASLRYQAEFQEARESAAREVQRTRVSMQNEVETANHQVNVIRGELEDQISGLRAQLDQVRMDADTAKAQHEMLLEEAQNCKQVELEDLVRRHQNEMEDMQARYERQIGNTVEDAQRTEQHLLERLDISTSKSKHLQDKISHLEEKLEIAKQAAQAAAQAAKSSVAASEPARQHKSSSSRQFDVPEKISPQALRESIMVLQEQLQEREHRIEELEQNLAKADPEAESKISKRDDEIMWLRELLAVRHADLQDIIAALGRDDYDRNAIKDAAIRLKANLQMEEQERERAMNGGSAINLPNIAATIRDAATPRVAQAVGPLAAAWGNWRKGRDSTSFGSLGNVLNSPAQRHNSTPSKSSPVPSNLLGGLLTPPASGLRQSPQAPVGPQPTAFSNTGRRFTAQDLANRPRVGSSMSTTQEGKMPALSSPPRRSAGPMTPPMMRPSVYDQDAEVGDFDDAGFFDD